MYLFKQLGNRLGMLHGAEKLRHDSLPVSAGLSGEDVSGLLHIRMRRPGGRWSDDAVQLHSRITAGIEPARLDGHLSSERNLDFK